MNLQQHIDTDSGRQISFTSPYNLLKNFQLIKIMIFKLSNETVNPRRQVSYVKNRGDILPLPQPDTYLSFHSEVRLLVQGHWLAALGRTENATTPSILN